jgi:hypothetical protein
MAPRQAPYKRRLAGRACEGRNARGRWTKTLPYIVTRLGLGLAVWCPPRRSPASASRYVTRRKYGTVHVKLVKVTVPAPHGRAHGESRNGMRGITCRGGCKISDAELHKFGQAAPHMVTPKANPGQPPPDVFVIQLDVVRKEWTRRKSQPKTTKPNET